MGMTPSPRKVGGRPPGQMTASGRLRPAPELRSPARSFLPPSVTAPRLTPPAPGTAPRLAPKVIDAPDPMAKPKRSKSSGTVVLARDTSPAGPRGSPWMPNLFPPLTQLGKNPEPSPLNAGNSKPSSAETGDRTNARRARQAPRQQPLSRRSAPPAWERQRRSRHRQAHRRRTRHCLARQSHRHRNGSTTLLSGTGVRGTLAEPIALLAEVDRARSPRGSFLRRGSHALRQRRRRSVGGAENGLRGGGAAVHGHSRRRIPARTIESDPALSRRFATVTVDELATASRAGPRAAPGCFRGPSPRSVTSQRLSRPA